MWSESFYPKGTIVGNLQEVKFHREEKQTNQYGFFHTNVGEVNKFTDVINFFIKNEKEYPSKKDFVDTLDWYFSHELAHINDWANNNNLSPEERVQFLYEVTEAFDAPDSFRDIFGYVAEIKDTDTQMEKYAKVVEYWAVVCEYYLTFSDDVSFEKEHPTEHKLIKKWLLSKDPNFDVTRSKSDRKKFIHENQFF